MPDCGEHAGPEPRREEGQRARDEAADRDDIAGPVPRRRPTGIRSPKGKPPTESKDQSGKTSFFTAQLPR